MWIKIYFVFLWKWWHKAKHGQNTTKKILEILWEKLKVERFFKSAELWMRNERVCRTLVAKLIDWKLFSHGQIWKTKNLKKIMKH